MVSRGSGRCQSPALLAVAIIGPRARPPAPSTPPRGLDMSPQDRFRHVSGTRRRARAAGVLELVCQRSQTQCAKITGTAGELVSLLGETRQVLRLAQAGDLTDAVGRIADP